MFPFGVIDAFLMFFFYGFVGWIVEVVYYGLTEGKFINRGYLKGFCLPVYGIGFYFVILMLRPFMNSFPMLFFGSATICTLAELIAGVVLYQIFHLRWWDYSDYRGNFKGFICVRFYIYWGVACSLGMYILHPFDRFVLTHMPMWGKWVLFAVFMAGLIVDLIVSTAIYAGLSKKVKAIEKLSAELSRPSDAVGAKVYETVETVVNTTQPVVESYQDYRTMVNEHRTEEKNLAKKHREEEKELLTFYYQYGKKAVIDSGKAKISDTVGGLLETEKKVLERISFSKMDLANATAVRWMKEKAGIKTVRKEKIYEDDGSL